MHFVGRLQEFLMGRKTDYYIRLNLLLAYVNCNKFTDRKKDNFFLMSLGEILLWGIHNEELSCLTCLLGY